MARNPLDQRKRNMPLWGLIHERRYADHTGPAYGCLLSKSHFDNGVQVDGLLLFTSPLHAEIYCRRLHTLGETAWRRYCIADHDIGHILAQLPDDCLKLWIALGFSASEMQHILLDDSRMFMTPSIGIDADLLRSADGGNASPVLPDEALPFLHALLRNCWKALDAAGHDKQLAWMDSWGDGDWDERATDALNRIATMAYVDYQQIWGCERPGVALALFEPITEEWLFHGETAGRWH